MFHKPASKSISSQRALRDREDQSERQEQAGVRGRDRGCPTAGGAIDTKRHGNSAVTFWSKWDKMVVKRRSDDRGH